MPQPLLIEIDIYYICEYRYDVTRLRMFGWTPTYSAEEAIRKAVKENINN